MRVIGGEFRGRRLRAPRGDATRPTSDKVREALFDIIASKVVGARFLDAYAGTGAVGIESLSRGARRAVFVESSRAAAKVLASNLDPLGVSDRTRVILRPFIEAVDGLAREEVPFDIAYLDPPYAPGELLRAVRLLGRAGFIAAGGLVIAEHESKLALPEREGLLALKRSVRYGRSTLSFFESD